MAGHNLPWLVCTLALMALRTSSGFVVHPVSVVKSPSSLVLQAKKKANQTGKGFAKSEPKPAPSRDDTQQPTLTSDDGMEIESPFLQSVEKGGSYSIPQMQQPTTDSSLPPEERTKQILRENYGMRTLGEQRMEDQIQEQKKKIQKLKEMAEKDEDIDIMAMLPAPVLKGIDTFLKLGAGVCTVLFVLAGAAITVEAWSKASNSPLPDDIDSFITNVIEPNFTTGLLVLLGFSVSLGLFASAQLGSAAAQYKED